MQAHAETTEGTGVTTTDRELPTVTVVICTWNRSSLLRRTLEEFERLELPPNLRWELLVVDNGSTDDTPQVVATFVGTLPVRRVVEARQGLSHARNRALAEATGNLLLWTDDDVLVGRDWITAYLDATEEFPEAQFFGGTVDPWFETTPPRWIEMHLDEFAGAFAIRQLDEGVRPLEPPELPFGANMAMRREAVRHMRFDPALGRSGEKLLSGEETDFLRRLREVTDHPGVWVGDARVRHFIPSERLNRGYLSRYFKGLGTSAGERAKPGERAIMNVPLWTWREYVERSAVYVARWFSRNDAWARAFRRRAYLSGYIGGCRHSAKSG